MAHLSAMVILTGASGVPEDACINTFNFDCPDAEVATAEALADQLVEFYNVAPPGGSPANVAISQYMGFGVKRDANACRIKVYDMGLPKPRPVLHEETFTLGGIGSGYVKDLPAEVALCVSFFADRNLPRQRGRVYLGPLGDNASAMTTARAHPVLTFRQSAAAAMKRLIDKPGSGPQLAVFSRGIYTVGGVVQPAVPGTLRIATAGWCDDAFDTQRRRGPKATTRTTF